MGFSEVNRGSMPSPHWDQRGQSPLQLGIPMLKLAQGLGLSARLGLIQKR